MNGANINFLDGVYQDITDAVSIETQLLAAVKAGLMAMPRYIRPGASSVTGSTPEAG